MEKIFEEDHSYGCRWRESESMCRDGEGLYRRAIDLLKAPPLENGGALAKIMRKDIVALARGGYADVLCVQQNRKDEGDRVKSWAESAWRNRRMTLAEALEISETCSKVPVIDTRIGRVL
ncbi:hypothetical protein L1049_008754 [Liquidambar formosana]|uniref:Uncharacterized protein n=1 Tax=Liquidambar formosana TaxID=63359 RepID=A0AAP0S410_LIQFO